MGLLGKALGTDHGSWQEQVVIVTIMPLMGYPMAGLCPSISQGSFITSHCVKWSPCHLQLPQTDHTANQEPGPLTPGPAPPELEQGFPQTQPALQVALPSAVAYGFKMTSGAIFLLTNCRSHALDTNVKWSLH